MQKVTNTVSAAAGGKVREIPSASANSVLPRLRDPTPPPPPASSHTERAEFRGRRRGGRANLRNLLSLSFAPCRPSRGRRDQYGTWSIYVSRVTPRRDA